MPEQVQLAPATPELERAAPPSERAVPPSENDQRPIAVKDLSKAFGQQRVLDHINFAVNRSETIAVLGQSGTGKSVLLKLLVGLHQPDSGSICIHGLDIAGLDSSKLADVRKRIGFLFQQGALYDSLSVEENVAFPLRRHKKMSDADVRKRAQELLASVGMEKEGAKMPSEISGGMQRRVGLARALALDPDILLLDEPTAGLDPITSAEIAKLIGQQRKDRQATSIVVTHDIHNARAFADRMIVLHQGRLVMEGTYDELGKSRDPFVKRYLQDAA